MKFDIISIVYLAILLIFLIIGIKKGLFKILINFIKGVISFSVSLLLAKPLGKFLTNAKLGESLNNKILGILNGLENPIFQSNLTSETKDTIIENALTDLKIPDILHDWLGNLISSHVTAEGCTVSEAISPVLTYYVFYSLSFIVIFLLVLLCCKILTKIFDKLAQIPFVGFLNRLLGGLLNLLMGAIIVCFISYAFTLIIPLDLSLSQWLVKQMGLDDASFVSVSKFFYENNFVQKVVAFVASLFK